MPSANQSPASSRTNGHKAASGYVRVRAQTYNMAAKSEFAHKPNIWQKYDKSSSQRISLNRSQYRSCSTGYNPLTSNQVVYK